MTDLVKALQKQFGRPRPPRKPFTIRLLPEELEWVAEVAAEAGVSKPQVVEYLVTIARGKDP